jgi:hypothetical protein
MLDVQQSQGQEFVLLIVVSALKLNFSFIGGHEENFLHLNHRKWKMLFLHMAARAEIDLDLTDLGQARQYS